MRRYLEEGKHFITMPLKLISQIMKPRSLKSLIFIALVCTAILALYQLFLGNSSRPIPTPQIPFEDSENFKNSGLSEILDEFDNEIPEVHSSQTEDKKHPDLSKYALETVNVSVKYAKERKAGRCLKVQSFKPDFDALDVYPNFEFDVRNFVVL
jgi:hypothetical protein